MALVVTADNGCIDSDTQSVPVYCIPVATYTAIGVCLKAGTEFTNTSTVNNSTIAASSWNFGDGTTGTDAITEHSFPSSGSFPVTLIVTTADGCKDTLVQTVSITDGPVAEFTTADSTIDAVPGIAEFYNTSQNETDVFFDFGDNSGLQTGSLTSRTHHIYNSNGVFAVCMIAKDAFECLDTVCHQVTVSAAAQGPTAFSPNGDGQNDVFYVFGGPFRKLEFKVYNNWGEVIFFSDTQAMGWDGKFKGVEQPIGVYVYTIEAVTENDVEYKVAGDVTLMR